MWSGRLAGRLTIISLFKKFQGAVTRLLTRMLNLFRIDSIVLIGIWVDFLAVILTRLLTRARFFQVLKISLSIPTIKYYRT